MRVRVHPHRGRYLRGLPDVVSVTPHPGSGVFYREDVVMHDVSFTVHRSGFERMRREGRRNVHAWAIGEGLYYNVLGDMDPQKLFGGWTRVFYDFQNGFFIRANGVRIDKTEVFPVAWVIGPKFYIKEQQ